SPFHLKMGRDKELIEIRHRDSFFQVGEAPVGNSFYQGVFMGEKNYATLGITKDEGIGLLSLKEINIALGKQSNDSEPFHLNMSRDKELIEIRHRGSFFQVGQAPVGDRIYQGIVMGEKNYATLGINKDEGIGLITKKRIKLEAESELSIVAEGDINIRSKNGVVKINGKKIYMSKEDSRSSGTSDILSPENNLKQSYEKDRNSFNAKKIMQTSLKSRGFYDGAVDGSYGPNTKKALQEFLRKEGFYQGRVDGHSGEALRDAIKQYQKSNGLKITGDINLETANAMQR
ncbi:MAG: peptidoglycan-binding protein, partial [Proteobacteria bacterium]|nr:peptidoglycan-binding protein [Pseudomonadota bacterium]